MRSRVMSPCEVECGLEKIGGSSPATHCYRCRVPKLSASAALNWASSESLLLRGRVAGRVRGLRYSQEWSPLSGGRGPHALTCAVLCHLYVSSRPWAFANSTPDPGSPSVRAPRRGFPSLGQLRALHSGLWSPRGPNRSNRPRAPSTRLRTRNPPTCHLALPMYLETIASGSGTSRKTKRTCLGLSSGPRHWDEAPAACEC